MSRNRQYRYFCADFETTVYQGQVNTEVWCGSIVELHSEKVMIVHSIDEMFHLLKSMKCNMIVYFHNLKFDGSFWLSYLLIDLKMKQAVRHKSDSEYDVEWLKNEQMENNTFKYSISDKGMWYTINIKVNDYMIELRDSLKLLPFSVKEIGKSFKTEHKKLDMEYTGFRYAGCTITDEEQEYIKNDVLVPKEALEIMFEQGHSKLTIGACCLSEFKRIITKTEYAELFPNLYDRRIDFNTYGSRTEGDYIRRSYKGGWCYLVKGKENKIYHNGITADVNSLYPSMMHSESGNEYPIGYPTFWKGNEIPDKAIGEHKYFFVRIKTRFYLKENMLPFIQIKGSPYYKGTEALESSDVYSKEKKMYCPFRYDDEGNEYDTRVTLTLTCTDYYLFLEHYYTIDFEILDGCYFNTLIGIFDEYIDIYKKQKQESTGALRTLAKLFLNNLYGKFASSDDSSFKYAYVKEDQTIGFVPIEEHNKQAGYIPIGSAITSYARNFTIRSAQMNYYGVGQRGFIYADTDSIHCDLEATELKGIKVHDKDFCCWKLESSWDEAIFTRQKTYIEHVTHENLEAIEEPYYNVKCAGMPDRCKDLFVKSMEGYVPTEEDDYNEVQREFLKTKRSLSDFKIGLKIFGKLTPKRIRGGILLVEGYYEMRE